MSHPRVRVYCTEIYGIVGGTPGCRQSAHVVAVAGERETEGTGGEDREGGREGGTGRRVVHLEYL